MKNIYKILGKLHDLSGESNEDKIHFEALGVFILAKDYAGAARHINEYRPENQHTEYQKTLQELLPHYKIRSPDDANKRLLNLLLAIKSKDREHLYAQVEKELQTGGALVVDAVYSGKEQDGVKIGDTPLMAAIAESNAAVIRLLHFTYDASLNNVADINAALNANGDTALHIACRLNNVDLIRLILEKNPNTNIQNSKGETALHIATVYCGDDIQYLLLNTGANPGISAVSYGVNATPFLSAYVKKKKKLMLVMMQKGYEVPSFILNHAERTNPSMHKFLVMSAEFIKAYNKNDRRTMLALINRGYRVKKYILNAAKNTDPDLHKFLMSSFKLEKTFIMTTGGMTIFAEQQNDLSPLYNTLFSEDPDLSPLLKRRLDKLYYYPDSILKPLLDIAILAAAGGHKNKSGKKLKIIITATDNVSKVTPAGAHTYGAYTGKNTVFIASHFGDRDRTLSNLLHELKHFVDAQIYGFSAKPYFDNQKAAFLRMKGELRSHAAMFLLDQANRDNITDIEIYTSIQSIFTDYKPQDQDDEILVKLPEIIGFLGMKKGLAWLNEHEPALLQYYENYFNPACEAYLASKKTERDKLQTDPRTPRK